MFCYTFRAKNPIATGLIAGVALSISLAAAAEHISQTIYKLTEDSGKVTYANSPMKGAVIVNLEPLSVITLSTPKPAPILAPDAIAVTSANDINISNANKNVTETVSAGAMLSKRRDDIRRRIVSEEISQEEQQLAATKKLLDETSRNTDSFRAIRATMSSSNTSGVVIDPATRVAVEKHFEQKRILLDEIDSHERNLAMLKLELKQANNITVSSN